MAVYSLPSGLDGQQCFKTLRRLHGLMAVAHVFLTPFSPLPSDAYGNDHYWLTKLASQRKTTLHSMERRFLKHIAKTCRCLLNYDTILMGLVQGDSAFQTTSSSFSIRYLNGTVQSDHSLYRYRLLEELVTGPVFGKSTSGSYSL